MSRKPKAPRDDPAESKRFIEMAREIEADERPETFDRAFEKVVSKKRSAAARSTKAQD
jgi:hypothetical protein